MAIDVNEDALASLRVIAEPTRWRIVQLLAAEELCVCHLVEELDLAQPLVSHHLRVLREAGLVETERQRYWTYYRLRPETLRRLAADFVHIARSAPRRGTERRPCC